MRTNTKHKETKSQSDTTKPTEYQDNNKTLWERSVEFFSPELYFYF